MDGIGKKMPLTMGAFLIGSLGVIGLPPTFGLISKFHLVIGAGEVHPVLMVVFLVSTLLNAAYFFPIVFRAFFPKGESSRFSWNSIEEAPAACVIPICVTACLTIILFIFPGVFLKLAHQFIASIM